MNKLNNSKVSNQGFYVIVFNVNYYLLFIKLLKFYLFLTITNKITTTIKTLITYR